MSKKKLSSQETGTKIVRALGGIKSNYAQTPMFSFLSFWKIASLSKRKKTTAFKMLSILRSFDVMDLPIFNRATSSKNSLMNHSMKKSAARMES
jgi:hypothetical protein